MKEKRELFTGILKKKNTQRSWKPSDCSQDCPGTFSAISYALSYSILDDSLMVLGIYFVDLCGRKGPRVAVLKLNLCLFDMFFILLMPLIPSENNLHTCPSSDSMVEIAPCFYSNHILNHSPVLAHGFTLEIRLFTLINHFCMFSSMFDVSFLVWCSSLCIWAFL